MILKLNVGINTTLNTKNPPISYACEYTLGIGKQLDIYKTLGISRLKLSYWELLGQRDALLSLYQRSKYAHLLTNPQITNLMKLFAGL